MDNNLDQIYQKVFNIIIWPLNYKFKEKNPNITISYKIYFIPVSLSELFVLGKYNSF